MTAPTASVPLIQPINNSQCEFGYRSVCHCSKTEQLNVVQDLVKGAVVSDQLSRSDGTVGVLDLAEDVPHEVHVAPHEETANAVSWRSFARI